MRDRADRVAAHYKAGSYLPLTEGWIHGQVGRLERYEPVVWCHWRENQDVYPVPRTRDMGLGPEAGRLWYKLNWHSYLRLKFYPPMAWYLWRDRPCLIHAHFGPAGYDALRLARLARVPLVTSFYGFDLDSLPSRWPKWSRRYRDLFTHGDLFLAEGAHMRDRLIGMGCPEERVLVKHLGADLERLPFQPRRLEEDGEVRVLLAASFREKKGVPLAVEALGLAVQSDPGMKIRLTIIGDARPDNPAELAEKSRLIELVREYRLEDRVDLLGYRPYSTFLEQLYASHIFMAPSRTASDGDCEGGAPVSLIEASASGMPIISTFHCDIPEVVMDGNSGFLVREGDVEALAERLAFMVRDPGLWEKMGAAGRRHMEEQFDQERQARKLEDIYDHLTKGDR